MIRFLCALPYDSMQELMRSVVSNYSTIDFVSVVCDNSTCVKSTLQNMGDHIDAIISRGGMADILSEHFDVPVFKIPFSSYDILRALQAAHQITPKFLFIGTAEMVSCAERLCKLLQYTAARFETIYEPDDVYAIIKINGRAGCKLFVGDQQVAIDAKRLSYNYIPITSGVESIEETIKWAIITTKHLAGYKEKVDICSAAINALGGQIVILGGKGGLLYPSSEILPPKLLSHLKSRIPMIAEKGSVESVKTIQSSRYHIVGKVFRASLENYYLFSLYELPQHQTQEWIKYLRNDSREISENSLIWGIGDRISAFLEEVINYAELPQPILFVAEDGTECDKLVKHLFRNSALSRQVLTIIDCALLCASKLSYLLQNLNSPFYRKNGIIYMKNVDVLAIERQVELFSFFEKTNIFHRCKIFLSCADESFTGRIIQTSCADVFENFISVRIPPLREHPEDIGNIASLYISALNIQYGKQVVGVSQEALKELETNTWPRNISQIKRVLRRAVLNTNEAYLSAADVRNAIKEASGEIPSLTNQIDLNMSLRDIEKQIINRILREENYNQTVTAKRLGISRTTLWRILNE